MEGLTKDLRWLVHSFVNDIDERKQLFSATVVVELNQRKLKRIALDELINGTRIVAKDTPSDACGNCYMYGRENSSGFCDTHETEQPYSTMVLTYRQYCNMYCVCDDPFECIDSTPRACSGTVPNWEQFEIDYTSDRWNREWNHYLMMQRARLIWALHH